mgnify:FL=1
MDNALKAILIAVLIAVYMVVTFTIIMMNHMVCKIFNPKNLYRETKLNYFGTLIVATFFNITFLPYAIIYWFWVLCHVGRK